VFVQVTYNKDYGLFILNFRAQIEEPLALGKVTNVFDNVHIGKIKFSLSNPLEQCLDHNPGWLCSPGGINKDPTV